MSNYREIMKEKNDLKTQTHHYKECMIIFPPNQKETRPQHNAIMFRHKDFCCINKFMERLKDKKK